MEKNTPTIEDIEWMDVIDRDGVTVPQSDAQLDDLRAVLKTYRHMHSLTGEIIATLLIPKNQVAFATLPARWHEIVEVWKERYKELNEALIRAGECDPA